MGRANLLIVDDDEDMLAVLAKWCRQEGYDVETVKDGFEALFMLKKKSFDLVVTDLAMPGMSGLKLLEMLKTYDPGIEVVILTGHGTLQTAVEALREGKAFDYLRKPLGDLNVLTTSLARALERRRTSSSRYVAEPGTLPEATFLTDRETHIARLLKAGDRPEVIAAKLSLSLGTVKNHLSAIYDKLGVRNRADAVLALRQYRLG